METATIPKWHITGTLVQACNCDWGCPCEFNAPPTQGHCDGTWVWHIERGSYGDVKLDGLNFAAACKWPGEIYEGNGECQPILDAQASPEQIQVIRTLLSGDAGGPWSVIAATLTKVHAPKMARWHTRIKAANTTIKADDALNIELTPLKNPATGEVHEANVLLPTSATAKELHHTTTSMFTVNGDVAYDYTGKHAAWGNFEYSGPAS